MQVLLPDNESGANMPTPLAPSTEPPRRSPRKSKTPTKIVEVDVHMANEVSILSCPTNMHFFCNSSRRSKHQIFLVELYKIANISRRNLRDNNQKMHVSSGVPFHVISIFFNSSIFPNFLHGAVDNIVQAEWNFFLSNYWNDES